MRVAVTVTRTCCIQFKRVDRSHDRVAIYKNQNSTIEIIPPIIIISCEASAMDVLVEAIGDICNTKLKLENGQQVLAVVVYISLSQRIQAIMKFKHFVLLYTPAGSALLGKNFHSLPMKMSGDLNKNVNDPEAQSLIEFLKD